MLCIMTYTPFQSLSTQTIYRNTQVLLFIIWNLCVLHPSINANIQSIYRISTNLLCIVR